MGAGDRQRGLARPGAHRLAVLAPAAVLAAAAAAFARRTLEVGSHMAEDAYIALRFARNLAEGHGLVWNVGGEPVEGFTSPLHVALLGLGHRLGLPAEGLAQGLGLLAVAAAAALFLVGVRRALGGLPLAALLVLGLALADARLALHATAGLETPVYAALLLVVWLTGFELVRAPGARPALALALANLVALLTRPDAGAWIAGQGLVVGGLALQRWRASDPALLRHASFSYALLVTAGLAYLGWKLSYFGYLLPNPFYIKSGGVEQLYGLHAVREYLSNTAWLGVVASAGLLLADRRALRRWLRRPDARAALALLLVPTALFLAYYVTVIHEVSFADRFELPTFFPLCLAVALVLGAGRPAERLGAMLARRLGPRAAWAGLAVAGALAVALVAQQTHFRFPWFREMEERYYGPLADALRTTELGPRASFVFSSAGVVPYRSRFAHVDPVGLCDNTLSGREPITALERERYLFGLAPDLYFGPEPPALPKSTGPGDAPRLRSDYVRRVLLDEEVFRTHLQYLRHYGGLSRAERSRAVYERMRFLRDDYVLLGEIPYPYPSPPEFTTFAYVRRDSPHRETLEAALEPLLARPPEPLVLEEPAPAPASRSGGA